MHEMGIAMQLIEIACDSIPDELAGVPVRSIHLNLGRLSAVVPDSLRFCFEIASKGTGVEGAKLVINEIPVKALCKDCGHRWTIETPAFACSNCGGGSIQLLSGRELDILSIEMADGVEDD